MTKTKLSFLFVLLGVFLLSSAEAKLNANLSTVCLHGYFYDPVDETCTTSCQPRYYGNYSTGICEPCDASCYSCSGSTSTDCITCKDPYPFIFQDYAGISCLSSCSSIAGATNYSSVCSRCSAVTVSYFLDTNNNSDVCEGWDSSQSTCTYTQNSANYYCYALPTNCSAATTPSSTTCTSCSTNYELLPLAATQSGSVFGTCLNTSPNSQISLDSSYGTFVYCQANCTNCTANRTCLNCTNGLKSFGGYCVLDACPNNTVSYKDSCNCSDGYFPDPCK